MPYYEVPTGAIHFLDSVEFEDFLPDGWVRITDEEAMVSLSKKAQPAKVLRVSRFQARAALLQAGLLDNVEAYMALDTTDSFTKLAWTDAQEFNRSSPLVESIGLLIGLTPEQLDDLFVFANTISA